MNSSFLHVLALFARLCGLGVFVGLISSMFTMGMLRVLARRTEHYKPTYMPMRLVESKVIVCMLITYPILFALLFALLFAFKVMN